NETGYQKMAEVWFGTLDGFLPDCAVPAISSSGGTAIFLGDTYTYDVQAAGYPLPAFSLQNAPAGMSIDPATGLISWTPAANQIGQFSFTIVAANSEGTASQPVTLTVRKLLFLPLIIRQTTN
ncbi:MAG TPA: hypothetical protein EYH05_18665, partial [Anaerolineae bacterium]|nr:hypothetical protein [Anaerolineae bacterium]